MVRPTDQERITVEKEVVTVPKRRAPARTMQGHTGKQCWSGDGGVGGTMSKGLYCGFQRKKPARQGKQASDWLD